LGLGRSSTSSATFVHIYISQPPTTRAMLDTLLTLAVIASTIFTVGLLLVPNAYHSDDDSEVSVQVLVLGDIGRSPRMQYHALSIAKHGGTVQLIGYVESELLPAMIDNPRVSIIPLSSPPRSWQTSNKIAFLFFAPLKVIFQVLSLCQVLGYQTKASKWMLVQVGKAPALRVFLLIYFS
jgi:beta-1,4-mannosyltransferase